MFHEFIKKPKEKGKKRKQSVFEQVKDEVVNVEDDEELLKKEVTVTKEKTTTDSKIKKFKRKKTTK